MSRKQPIPTDLGSIFGDNYLAQDIYILFLLRARNSEDKKEEEYGGSLHFIGRGQGVFGDNELAKRFRVDRKTVRKTLEKMENLYNKVDIKRTTKGSIYTLIGYDEIVSMDNKTDNGGTTRGQQKDNSVDTNKSDKSIEIEKIEELEAFVSKRNFIKKIKNKKGLPKTIKITSDLKKIWKTRLSEYTIQEIKDGVNNYCTHIMKIKEDEGYVDHRFTLYEFLKQKNGLQKFINFTS